MYEYLVSACLAGVNCRYDGSNNINSKVKKLVNEGKALPICPEVMAGLGIPRPMCEIKIYKNDEKSVINENGLELTSNFKEVAKKCLKLAEIMDIKKAILKSKSPSCGSKYIYDGTFSGNLIKGKGITAEYLSEKGIDIFTEKEIEKI